MAKGVEWWTPGTAPKLSLTPVIDPPPPPPPPSTSDSKADEPDPGIRVSEADVGTVANTITSWVCSPGTKRCPRSTDARDPFLSGMRTLRPSLVRNQTTTRETLNTQGDVWHEHRITSYSNSQWCARPCLPGRHKGDRGSRVVIDYRPLDSLNKKDRGGIGTLATMHHRIKGSKFYTLLDLPQGSPAPDQEIRQAQDGFPGRTRSAVRVQPVWVRSLQRASFLGLPGRQTHCGRSNSRVAWSVGSTTLFSTARPSTNTLLSSTRRSTSCRRTASRYTSKSVFCMPEVEFLGVMVGRAGVRPAPSKVKALKELEVPTTVGECARSWASLGSCETSSKT